MYTGEEGMTIQLSNTGDRAVVIIGRLLRLPGSLPKRLAGSLAGSYERRVDREADSCRG
jgi:hypothetical protein